MNKIEVITKGIKNEKSVAFEVGNVRILNVMIPTSEETKSKYQLVAERIIKKCGIRNKITYYPIPTEIAKRKEMVPYFFVCLTYCREKKMREIVK